MSEWIPVGTTEAVPPSTSKVVIHERESIAIFNVDGAYFAMAQEFGLEVEDFVEDDQ